MSYGDLVKLTGEQEQALLEKAFAEAQATSAEANTALTGARNEATAAQRDEASRSGVASTQLSGTSSYSRYLQLKVKAEQQYQAALNGGSSTSSSVRATQARRSGVADAWTQQGDALEARAQRLADAASSDASGITKWTGEQKARADKSAADAKARADADAESSRKFYSSVWEKLKRERGPTPTMRWSGMKPETVYDWGDSTRWAQMLVGAQDRGDWQMPGMTEAERANTGKDFRGEWLKRQASGKW